MAAVLARRFVSKTCLANRSYKRAFCLNVDRGTRVWWEQFTMSDRDVICSYIVAGGSVVQKQDSTARHQRSKVRRPIDFLKILSTS